MYADFFRSDIYFFKTLIYVEKENQRKSVLISVYQRLKK